MKYFVVATGSEPFGAFNKRIPYSVTLDQFYF